MNFLLNDCKNCKKFCLLCLLISLKIYNNKLILSLCSKIFFNEITNHFAIILSININNYIRFIRNFILYTN